MDFGWCFLREMGDDVATYFILKVLLGGLIGKVRHVVIAEQIADLLQIYGFDVFCYRFVLPTVVAWILKGLRPRAISDTLVSRSII